MSQPDTQSALEQLTAAVDEDKITAGTLKNLREWLTNPSYQQYVPQILEHIEQQDWQTLDDVFWTVIPFGTGGRRGKMYPIGSNAINDRTMGESAQGLADYVKQHHSSDAPLACAIAYDTRHRSREFAELCAEIMVEAGFRVYFLDDYRSTPELSFAVRMQNCACGIMVTASHNPPSDNAIKAYWSTGGQILPPHDQGVIDRVMQVQEIRRKPFAECLQDNQVVVCTAQVDRAFIEAVASQALSGPRDLRIIYSPLHGVGASAVCPVLEADGFTDVELFAPHATPDGDFPNVPGHVSNPENPAVFDSLIERAQEVGAELVMATDPDCDRIGCAAPLTLGSEQWRTLSGNQIGALLTEYILSARQAAGTLSADQYVVKTLVTTDLVRRISDSYGVKTYGNLLVGFKWIGAQMDAAGPDKFLFGAEESHGYLVGQYARDKDASVAAMLLAELAAQLKEAGESLHEKLDALFWQQGAHAEKMVSVQMPGSEGMERIQTLMARFREAPPTELAQMPTVQVRDYLHQTVMQPGAKPQPLDCPQGNMVILDLETEGTYVAVRPSGTEPKVKFYMFTYHPPEQIADLEETKQMLAGRLDALAAALSDFAESV